MSEDNSKVAENVDPLFGIEQKKCEPPKFPLGCDPSNLKPQLSGVVESGDGLDVQKILSSLKDGEIPTVNVVRNCCDNCAKMPINNYKNTGCPFGKYNPIIGKFEQVFPPKVNWDKFNDWCTRFEIRKTDIEEKVSDAFSSEITYKRPY